MESAKRGGSHYLFLATILTGSFLLFLVQPMVARMALPRLGGAPAVWNSAMLVYQALLLGGYAYAHRLSREAPRRQAMIHIALLLVAALWLPLGLASFQPPADGSPIFWVPWLLIASIGPLFFAVAAQAPLMQRWYGFAGNVGEPYALYAVSNIGSFAGLITYPLLVEPFMPLQAQNWLWTAIYAVLVLAVAACARLLWRTRGDPAPAVAQSKSSFGWKRRLYWIVLAAIPSGLMLSTTSHLTTDLMAMPLVWVIPLGLYLLSFSIAFADNQRPAFWITKFAPPVMMITGAVVFLVWGKAAINGFAASLSLLFVVAVALHNEMYRTRPAPAELTGFYLMMSVGGVVGGFFCAIVAPLIFDWTWEHPILILLAAVMLPQTRLFSLGENETLGRRGTTIMMLVLGAVALAAGIYGGLKMPLEADTAKIVLLIVIILLGIIVTGRRFAFACVIAALMFANGGWHNMEQTLDGVRMRSYFGTYTVNATESGRLRWLNHGTTMHGMQMLEEPDASIGVVGLGTGTLACYHKPGQSLQFFEIDPLMVEIARTKGIFSFVERCAPEAKVTLGDARLTLAAVPRGKFDILALDAFSSDSIPLHLLTREAFAVYRRVLKPDGLLLVHISNRYVDLNPVVAAEAKTGGWVAALRHDSPPAAAVAKGARSSQWIALSPDSAKLAQLTGRVTANRGRYYQADLWITLDPPGKTQPWTDDYASVLPHLSLWKTLK